VVAPDSDQSGTGASLGRFDLDARLEARPMSLPDAPGVEAWAVAGPPALCTVAALLEGFGERPSLVVSGINAGLNTGRSVLHSGTVGAVLTGQNFGVSGLAVSVQSQEPWHWDTAASFAVEVTRMLADAPPRSALNLNVPALPRHQVKGIRWARLAPFGEVRAAMRDSDDGPANGSEPGTRSLQVTLEFSEHDFDAETDQGLVRAGYASLTTLVGVSEAWPGDHGLVDDTAPVLVDERIAPGAPLNQAHKVPDASAHDVVLRRPEAES
jgi:5'-nucleotidase